ncbi:MAG: hypothetical protein HOM79_08630 [Alphaproteobacteria bacterium]|nr:hypothetical protein [Alphaproteobacteria bacterium]
MKIIFFIVFSQKLARRGWQELMSQYFSRRILFTAKVMAGPGPFFPTRNIFIRLWPGCLLDRLFMARIMHLYFDFGIKILAIIAGIYQQKRHQKGTRPVQFVAKLAGFAGPE